MSVDFKWSDFAYPAEILRLRAFFEKSQWFSERQFIQYQESRLRLIIRHAYDQVPYYRELFQRSKLRPEDISTMKDLDKIPPLTKELLRRNFVQLQAADKQKYRPKLFQTSGTTGEPLSFFLDKPAQVLEFVHYWRHWSWAGYRLGNRFAEFSSHYFLKRNRPEIPYRFQPGTNRLLLNSLSFCRERMRAYISALKRYRPRYLKGTASALYYFAFFLHENGESPDLEFKAVFSTGETLWEHERRLVESVLGCKVYDSYGHMERTVAVSECPREGRHVNPEYGILEVFPDKVLGTSLHNLSMPLLRYETGDLMELEPSGRICACGRRMPLVKTLWGRAEDVIVTPGGKIIPTAYLVFGEIPGLVRGQMIQEETDSLRIRMAVSPAYTPASEARLRQIVSQFTGPEMKIEYERVSLENFMPAGWKFRTVISKIKPAGLVFRERAVL